MSTPDEEVKERTDFLLEHMRSCGVFKCFECIYCKREDTHLGATFKCVHDGVAVHCAMKDEQDLMRGCACFWFEPRGTAGQAVARRQAQIMDAIRSLYEYADDHTEHTVNGNGKDERNLAYICNEFFKAGVRL